MESHGNGVVDFGRFLTGFFVVMGIGTSDQAACPDALRRKRLETRSATAAVDGNENEQR